MIRKLVLVAGFSAAMTAPSFAAEWVVIRATDGCYVTDEMGAGENKVGGPYASKEEAEADMNKLAVCEKINNDLDPTEDRDTR